MTWDYDKTEYEQQADFDEVWRLERLIKYGPERGEKINKETLRKNWPKLKIPDDHRAFLELLLWNRKF